MSFEQEETKMLEVLHNPASTYTEQAEAIDRFFDSWGRDD